jgi:hydroxyacylglutathione hydrolase
VAFRSSYATWLGWLAPLGTPLLFVLGSVPLDGVIDESLLIGQERFEGWLEGGVEAWKGAGSPAVSTQMVGAAGVRDLAGEGATLVDVREPDEYAVGHIPGAIQIPLGTLQANLERIPRDRPAVTYCAMGERSASAASILERNGFAAVRNLEGGIEAWCAAGQRVAV